MKILRLILLVIIAALTYLSCQREIYFDGISVGKLKKDAFGNCSPVSVGGSYKTDTALTITNFVDVQVDVSFSGTYEIRSDTINGYYFIGTGTVDKGLSTVRLFGKGKPNISGNNNFTVTYGNSFCNFYITVSPPSVAVFSLGGSPDSCTAATIAGNYIEGIALTTDNTITVQANVALPGLYTISASTNNGFQFLANGIFTASGLQNVTLKGTGKPIRAEVSNITVANIVSTCNFPVTVLSDTVGKAMFSFDGTPNTCINYTVNGNYYAGIAANGNSVTMNVTVTKPGSYYIITNTANGITFSNVGSFLSTGQQTVTLSATGNPINSGPVAFIPNTGTQSCSFLVNVQPLPPPALFTLSGSPSACAPVTVNGFYIHSKPLDAANTVVIQVDVSTPGSYSFSTNTVNGMTFSASGVFTATGLQNVTLHGSGTPQITGTTILTPRYSTSSCSFNVTVQ